MRYKVVPPVEDRPFLESVADAVPLVPGSEEDCCTRIRDRTTVAARDDAREWLTFCQALGLVAETERGFHRVREPPSAACLRANFRERVYGVEEVLSALGEMGERGEYEERDEPVTVDDLFADAVEPMVPQWERSRHDDWRETWRERTARIVGWADVFGLVERTSDGALGLPAGGAED